jgi:kinesin family protein 13
MILFIVLQRTGFISEPAVFVKYKNKGSQVWSMDKFENKLIDMRDVYQERKDKGHNLQVSKNSVIS